MKAIYLSMILVLGTSFSALADDSQPTYGSCQAGPNSYDGYENICPLYTDVDTCIMFSCIWE